MLFVPLWDMNRLKSVDFQYVTVTLIVLNAVVFFAFQAGFVFPGGEEFTSSFSVVPRDLFGEPAVPVIAGEAVAPPEAQTSVLPERLTLLTYMFLHGNILHLGSNMLFLFIFGDNVEDAMGHFRFLLFYLFCGIFAGLAHVVMTNSPDAQLVGASGAIAGVIGAYVMLHPNIRVWVLIPKIPFIPLRFSAGFVIGFWVVLQFVSVVLDPNATTAWWAHIGGLIAGVILVLFMRRPGVPLFDKATGV
jgi:membrane associated rhomboid family serine protease